MPRLRHVTSRVALTGLVTSSLVALGATVAPSAHAFSDTFTNPAAISVVGTPSVGTSSPYPSTVNVAAMSGTVTSISLDLSGLRHTFPDDMDMLLVGPTGADLVVWSDVGGSTDLTGQDVTLTDGSPALPDASQVSAGSYAPTNIGTGDAFAVPAPASSAETTFAAAFNGTNPNGAWQLYVVDDLNDDAGSISGWSVSVTTTGSPTTTFGTSTPTLVPAASGSSPYPDSISVAGLGGVVSGASVTLEHLTHPSGTDLDVMLVGPGGQSIVLVSDIAGAANDVTLTFDDSGPAIASISSSGTFHPTNNSNTDWFPYPAPVSGSSSGFASIFGGTDPNGTWKLFVNDDVVANDGTIAGGWSLTLETKLPQTIIPGPAPAAPVVGDTYEVQALGGDSGNDVTVLIDPSTTADACSVDVATVSFDHAGTCVLDLLQAGDSNYLDAPTVQQTIEVAKAPQPLSFTSEPPTPGRINDTYDVTFSSPGGSGNPVVLALDATSTPGACMLMGFVVMLTGEGTCRLTLDRAGDADHLDAEQVTQDVAVVLSTPSITAVPTSSKPQSAAGWWRTPVTVTFTCDGGGSDLTGPCPEPVVVSTSGKAQQVTGSITTTDGAGDSVAVVVDLDRVRPTVRIKGITKGRTYTTVPKVRCVGKDTLSGIRSCTAKVSKKGRKLVFSATATDRAGNRATTKGTAIYQPR